MPTLRGPRSIVCAAVLAAAGLSGCGVGLKPDAPADVRMQGVWKLNRAASDDPQKIIDAMRAEALKHMRRAANAPPPPSVNDGDGDEGHRRRQPGSRSSAASDEELEEELPRKGPVGDPLRNSPMMHALRTILTRSDYLTIRQSPEQVAFDYGTTVRSYTPGEHSVVSSENGVADQTSGWDGKEYVIRIKPQLGPQMTEEYGLSPDGKQLIVKSHVGPFDLSKVNFTRVYDVTSTAVPNSAPSNE